MKPTLSISQLAIKFEYQFSAIFSKFVFLFMSFIFDKLAIPINERFKVCFKSFSESIPVQKTVSEVLKTW